MDAWQKIDESLRGDSGQYVKLNSGEDIDLVLITAPEEEPSPFDETKTRFTVQVKVLDNGEFVGPKTWTFGKTIMRQLLKLNAKTGGLEKTRVLNVSREGSGINDTRYTVIPTRIVSDEEMAMLDKGAAIPF